MKTTPTLSTRIVYVNGTYVPEEEAKISIFDRGLLFADGIYEVSAVLWGQLIDNQAHLARLRRSLNELELVSPLTDNDIVILQKELIKRNDLKEGVVYLQITRGPADRDFAYPASPQPSCIAFTQVKSLIVSPDAISGYHIITLPDIRWQRCDIKTTALLGASMSKMAALKAGANDAWLVDKNGHVTEGSSSNVWIVTGNTLITRPTGPDILAGITRRAVMELAKEARLTIEERPFTVPEAKESREAFITSASHLVWPVITIDGIAVGDGTPGPLSLRLRELYLENARAQLRSSAE
ncbi:MAG: D-amino acid aminotransferase [Deltaproteobacteria bacterium]|nr:MAG: D-amino acid aminotransferase [Deltaproteobacteria bacterium]